MKYNCHVITPFSRAANLDFYLGLLRPLGIVWETICDDTPEKRDLIPVEPWIVPSFAPPSPERWHRGAWPIYWHQCNRPSESADRYLILTDDDSYEPGFFDKIDAVEGECLVVSMLRGQHQPTGSGYGTETLSASTSHLHHGMVAGEQIVVSGRLWRKHRHLHTADGDWPWIAAITSECPPVFVPEAFVRFNYLEPGRWDK